MKTVPGLLLCAGLCGGFMLGHYYPRKDKTRSNLPLYFVDPMHPSYRSDKPGKAPDCGMELLPVFAEDVASYVSPGRGVGASEMHFDQAALRLYGISLTTVHARLGTRTLRMFGRVATDETRMYQVNFGTDGYVRETHNDAVGEHVRKDQHLATVYSPEFLPLVGGYLSANERAPGMAQGGSGKENPGANQNAASSQARADRLRNMGMSDLQIQEVSLSRKIPEDVYVVSPVDGFIVARTISQGLRFERHTDLYTIADLSRVWVIAQVSQEDAGSVRPGAGAMVTVPGTNLSLQAHVSSVLPEIDAKSHSLTVRLEAENHGLRLRPNMFVTVSMISARSSSLTIPAGAVLDSGQAKVVFVQNTAGAFERREVAVGRNLDENVEVLRGLSDGEIIASSNTFLLRSEDQLSSSLPSSASGSGDGGGMVVASSSNMRASGP